jgi:hypothetical protein
VANTATGEPHSSRATNATALMLAFLRDAQTMDGATHFLTRKLAGVSAEMNLNVLAYNLKRVMKIIGANGLMKALTA